MNEFDRYVRGQWAPGPDTPPSISSREQEPIREVGGIQVQPPLESAPGRLADVWQWYFERDRDKDAAFEHGLLAKEIAILLLLFIVVILRRLYL